MKRLTLALFLFIALCYACADTKHPVPQDVVDAIPNETAQVQQAVATLVEQGNLDLGALSRLVYEARNTVEDGSTVRIIPEQNGTATMWGKIKRSYWAWWRDIYTDGVGHKAVFETHRLTTDIALPGSVEPVFIDRYLDWTVGMPEGEFIVSDGDTNRVGDTIPWEGQ